MVLGEGLAFADTAPLSQDRGLSAGWVASEASWRLTELICASVFRTQRRGTVAPEFPPYSLPEAQGGERHPARRPSPYLSWLESITRLTVWDSVMWACTLCWPETRDTSFPEPCPAPVESSCLS